MGFGNYNLGTKEPNLNRSTSLASGDLIRVVVGGISRTITASAFATAIQAFFGTDGATKKIRSVSTSQSVLTDDEVLAMDASAASKSLVLPDCTGSEVWNATTSQGKLFTLKKDDNSANLVTINTTSSQTIDGDSSYVLSGSGRPWITVMSNGVEWKVVG